MTKDNRTLGQQLAATFRPFVASNDVREPDKVIEDIGKSIDRAINFERAKTLEVMTEQTSRTKQLLSALDYDLLTDFQAKIVLSLEQTLK